MSELKLSQPGLEPTLGSIAQPSTLQDYATGGEALRDLLAALDRARNAFRLQQLEEAETSAADIAQRAEKLLATSSPLPGLDAPQIALLCASALVIRGRAREERDRVEEAAVDAKRAAELFQRYIPMTQPSPETWGYYGVALRMAGRLPEAIETLRTALKEGSSTPELYRHLGWALKDEHRYEEAEEQLKQALNLAPSDARARLLLADTLAAQNRKAEAAEAYCEAARMAARAGDLGRALKHADSAIAADDTNVTAYAFRGEILRLMRRGEDDLKDALAAFGRSIELSVLQHGSVDAWVFVSRGLAFFDIGRTEEALSDFEKALGINPDYGAALEAKGHALYAANRNDEAVAALSKAVSLEGATQNAHVDLVLALMNAGRVGEALTVIDEALGKFPRDALLTGLRGEVLRLQGHNDEALRYFSESVEIDSKFSFGWAKKGFAEHELGRDEDALASLDKALELYPAYTWASIAKGTILEEIGKPEDAIVAYRSAAEKDSSSAWALGWLAQGLERAGYLVDSVAVADRALGLNADYPDVLITKGEALRRLCRFGEAVEVLDRAIAIDSGNWYGFATRGRVLRATGQLAEAIQAFEAARPGAKDAGWVLKELSDCYEQAGRSQEARELQDRVLAATPRDPYSAIASAEVLAAKAEPDQAVAAIEKLIEKRPRLAPAYEVLGKIRKFRQEYEPALAALDRALEIEATDAVAQAYRGQIFFALRQKDKAAEALEKAIQLNPYLDWAAADLTAVYRDLNQPEKALDALDLVLKHCPAAVLTLENKAQILCDIAEYGEALAVIQQAISLDGSRSSLYALKGWILDYSDRLEESLEACQKGFEIDSRDNWNRRGFADALRDLGRRAEAGIHYKAIIDAQEATVSDPWLLSLIGWCYYGLGDYGEAADFYNEALYLDPNLVSSQFDLALILAASNGAAGSLREYQRGVELTKSIGAPGRRGLLQVALIDLQRAIRAVVPEAHAEEARSAEGMLRNELEKAQNEAAAKLGNRLSFGSLRPGLEAGEPGQERLA